MHLFTKYFKRAAALLIGAASLAACSDSFIYDEEGDCDPHYKARFVFDYNMLYADAFSREVNAVTLYLIDPATGNIVWQNSESGDALSADGYLMDIDVAPGTYRLMAWCGEGVGEHFSVPQAEHHTGLKCTLKRAYENDIAVVRNDIKRLYHGAVRNSDGTLTDVVFPDDEGVYTFTIPLVKDTNDVNIVLQNLSGEEIDPEDFTFTLVEANGNLEWDNSMLDGENITYYPHHTSSGSAGLVKPEDVAGRATISTLSACLAEHTVSRLMQDQKMNIRIFNKTGKKIVDIPLTDYALMLKTSHYADMDNQEFLDRQDKYDVVFFLDEKGSWVHANIQILSWKLVIQNSHV